MMKNKIVNFICETEVLISFFMTLVIVITAYNINVYENLNQYIEAFKNKSGYNFKTKNIKDIEYINTIDSSNSKKIVK